MTKSSSIPNHAQVGHKKCALNVVQKRFKMSLLLKSCGLQDSSLKTARENLELPQTFKKNSWGFLGTKRKWDSFLLLKKKALNVDCLLADTFSSDESVHARVRSTDSGEISLTWSAIDFLPILMVCKGRTLAGKQASNTMPTQKFKMPPGMALRHSGSQMGAKIPDQMCLGQPFPWSRYSWYTSTVHPTLAEVSLTACGLGFAWRPQWAFWPELTCSAQWLWKLNCK